MNQGDDESNYVPPRSSDDSPALGQRVYDTARVQRTPQIAFIRDRLDQGLSPATVLNFNSPVLNEPLRNLMVSTTVVAKL